MMRFIFWMPLLLFFSCHKGHEVDCFKSTGSETTEVRYMAPFKFIKVYDKIEVNIFQGNEYKVEVIAGKHLIKNVYSSITNNLLEIGNSSACNFVRGYKRKIVVNVTVPYVAEIYNYSVGPITLDRNFNQDTMLFVRNEIGGDTYINGRFNVISTSSHGSGDMYMSGSSKTLLVYSKGTNYTYAQNLTVSDHVFVSTYSLGHVYLNLQGVPNFEYYIWSQGNIYYTGNPLSITRLEGTGTGQLIKQD